MTKRSLGRYELIGELGRGAMGVVYRATDPILARVVAVKTISMAIEAGELAQYAARFYQEARAAGGLNHPNIVTIFDVGKSDDIPYMAMEFLEGQELRALLASRAPLPLPRAAAIAIQVAEGLAYAHRHGVVHRDIKPANVMILNDGSAKITDFGIARLRSAEFLTRTGTVLGSPMYMSPEQVLGQRAEPVSDIFSLGAVLYEMLTGVAPFVSTDVHSTLYQIVNQAPPAPSTRNAAVPKLLDFIVAKALARDPGDRYRSAAELAVDLRQARDVIDGHAVQTVIADVPEVARVAKADREVSAPTSRRGDSNAPCAAIAADATDPSPTLGLAKDFDSLQATLRLALETGAAAEVDDLMRGEKLPVLDATAAHGEGAATMSEATALQAKAPRVAWSQRDRAGFAISVTLAIAVGAVIVWF